MGPDSAKAEVIGRKKVLIVSYFFPPTNAIGALRLGKLAKYLKEYGWEPWVLTIEKNLFSNLNDLAVEINEDRIGRADLGRFFTGLALKRKAASKAANIPPTSIGADASEPPKLSTSSTSFKSFASGLKKRLWSKLSALFSDTRFPDRALPWYLPALKKGDAILKTQQFDAIFSSFGPAGSHVIASVLAKRHRVPWVADFRDLWTQNHVNVRSPIFQWLEQRLEKRIMKRCFAMTTVSQPLKEQLESLHHKTVFVLPNGFDPEDYRFAQIPLREGTLLRIVYTGMLYPGKRDPSLVFQAAKELIDEGVLTSGSIRFEFYGVDVDAVFHLASVHGVRELVTASPRISHLEIIEKQLHADILLLLEWNDPRAKGVYTGKVFEYLGAGRPILAFGPRKGVIEELLKETCAGSLVSSAEDAKAVLREWISVWKQTGAIPYAGDLKAIQGYSRRGQAGVLAGLLDACSKDCESAGGAA